MCDVCRLYIFRIDHLHEEGGNGRISQVNAPGNALAMHFFCVCFPCAIRCMYHAWLSHSVVDGVDGVLLFRSEAFVRDQTGEVRTNSTQKKEQSVTNNQSKTNRKKRFITPQDRFKSRTVPPHWPHWGGGSFHPENLPGGGTSTIPGAIAMFVSKLDPPRGELPFS